ncbi:MAG: TlyA family RNA methyltransferase [Bacillota bacterium]
MKSHNRKERLDRLLGELHPDLSRSRIQAEIMSGRVLVNGRVSDKPGTLYPVNVDIELRESENPYVSRGGLKIEGALQEFSLDVNGLVILDVGSSTGGFTDCLLKKGAKLVYALDVGYGQLDASLRNSSRVVVMERFNVRHLKSEDLDSLPDLAVVDVSFISLSKVLPVLYALNIHKVLALAKPQFEVGRIDAGKSKGVIRDPKLHNEVLNNLVRFACNTGYCFSGITFSRWPGPKGNIEYFIYLETKPNQDCSSRSDYESHIKQVIDQAHTLLIDRKK